MAGTFAAGQKLPFIRYNTSNGLSHNRTHVILQDGKGYLWVGTDLGINRYDGRTFRKYPCPAYPYQTARYARRHGDSVVFCVDRYGLAICYGDSVRFVALNIKNIGSLDGVAPGKNGSFYVNNLENGLYEYRDGVCSKVPLPQSIKSDNSFTDLYKDRKSNLWLITTTGLVFFPEGNMRQPMQLPFFKGLYVYFVSQNRNGDIYVSAINGCYRYTEVQVADIMNTIPEKVLHGTKDITSMAFDHDGNTWMSSAFNGIYKYDKTTQRLRNYGQKNGMDCNATWNIFCDKENMIWVASENGLSKLSSHSYFSFDFTNEQYGNVKSACEIDDSSLLFTNLLDAYIYRNEEQTKVKGYKGVLGYLEHVFLKMPDNKYLAEIYEVNSTLDLLKLHDKTFIYELHGNQLVNGRSIKTLPGSPEKVYLYAGSVKYGDGIWLNTSDGLQRYSKGAFFPAEVSTKTGKKLQANYITSGRDGEMWLLVDYKDLARYQIAGPSAPKTYTLTQREYITGDKLGKDNFHKVFADSHGNIWLIGRVRGIQLLRPDAGGHYVLTDTNIGTRFSTGLVTDIAEDNNGNIWVGTSSGLDKVDMSKGNFEIHKDVYGSELCGKYIYFLKMLGGKLFVGTTGCMGVIDINKEDARVAPEIYLTGLRINERDATQLLGTTASLKATDNTISFLYTGISFRDERRIRYSYKLEGLDEHWSSLQQEFVITYSRIPPGRYTFKVRALSVNGQWSERPAEFTFVIAHPYYTRWWFVTLLVCLALGIVYTVYRYRINQFLKIQHIRQTISKDLHDDIGATVSSINLLANMAKSDLINDVKRSQFLETIQQESKYVSESINDIVWSINPKNDSIAIMYARMHRYATELFEAGNIRYNFNLPEETMDEISLDMTRRQQVYLIFKEAVNNLVKYSGASEATISIFVSKSEFNMEIVDNGKGFDTTAEYGGNGIYNMNKRAQDINATLVINSKTDAGTSISLKLAL